MRVLVTSTSGLGHLLPVLAIASAAVQAGHEVRVCAPSQQADRIDAQGLRWGPLVEPTEGERTAVRAATEDREVAAGVIFARLNPLAGLPGLEATIAEWHPDIVLSEAAEFAGGLAAERAGLPTVRLHPGMVHGSHWERMAAAVLSATRTEVGLPPDPAADRLISAPQLCYFPAIIESRPTDAPVTRVRRPGLPVPQSDREPLIYITLGSEIPKMPMFATTARAAVEAARRTGHRVILSIASGDPGALGDLSGIEVASWVDQTEVLPRARVVVSHGGAGTTLDALAAGTPMISIPFFADQPYNADSLSALEVGRTVRPGTDLASRLFDALDVVLTEEPRACAQMADAVAALPDISAGISLLELHAGQGPMTLAVHGRASE